MCDLERVNGCRIVWDVLSKLVQDFLPILWIKVLLYPVLGDGVMGTLVAEQEVDVVLLAQESLVAPQYSVVTIWYGY